ncbi:VCBS domain-containing protein [Methylogaea oryzae]|uniref:VCBS repeat-containing protein n=1 Tax=Methylogaea oryzae TaxID=1295382 RepID=A0A8D4VM01_9GAMM|nr:VCBS domain-containing protein [Methylogaea oryzae]BBL70280.1 hypothetical protein MoryE10_08860 [Methylogaea oryzae]
MAAQTTIKVATITGAAKDDSFSLTEDSNVSNLNVLSNDPGSAKIYSLAQNTSGLTSTSQYPVVNSLTLASGASISINPDGTIHYDAAGIKGLQSLAAGETYTDTFTYTIRMANGALSTATATVTIVGENDAPVITNATSELVGSVQEDNKTSVSGQLSATDVDHGATQTWSVQGSAAGTYGNLAVDSTGKWTYSLNNDSSNVQSLAAGEHHTESFTVRVTDDKGAFVDQTVTVTVNGTNDAPVVSGAVTGAATEDGASSSLNALANASDVDHNTTLNVTNVPTTLPAGVSYDAGTHTFTLNPGNAAYQSLAQGETTTVTVNYSVSDGITSTPATASWTVTGTNDAPVVSGAVTGTATEDGASSSLNALANASDVDNNTTLSVTDVPSTLPAGVSFDAQTNTFTLNPGNAAYQSLAQGETTTVTVNYSVSDGITSTPATASWTVTGTNDAPVVSGAVTGTATEDGASSSLNALANASDVDNNTTLSVTDVPSTLPAGVSFDAQTNTFTLNPGNAAYQSLAQGETTTVTVNYSVSDGITSTPATASWTVTGTNDAPVIDAGSVATGSVQEDVKTAVSGQLTATDVDNGATQSWSVQGSADGTYGSLAVDGTGQWTYTLHNSAANVQALAAGESHTETFTVRVADEHGAYSDQTVNVTVTGSNDAAAISGTNAGSVIEDGTTLASGTLGVLDKDAGQSTFAGVSGSQLHGDYGNFTFDAGTGEWTYALRNGDANVQALGAGTVVHDSLTVTSLDGSASKVITVDVNGTNDVATITGTNTGAVKEDVTLTAAGDLDVTDVDSGQSTFAAVSDTALHGTYGNFTFNSGTGAWTYSLRNADANVQNLKSGEFYHDTLLVQSADLSASTLIDVTVGGTDDVTSDTFRVSNGNGNSQQVMISGFDNNDFVQYSKSLAWRGDVSLQDVNGDGKQDLVTHFDVTNGRAATTEVVLLGYEQTADIASHLVQSTTF